MKIFITGGTGYVGFNLAVSLCQNPIISKVILYDNYARHNESVFFAPLVNPTKLQIVRADILDTRKLKLHMKESDAVVHLAARVTTPFANQDAQLFEQINHWGTAEVVYAAEEMAIPRFIYLSSAAVYGNTTEPATESTIPNPETYYGISKWRGEQQVNRAASKFHTHVIRCANVYGYSASLRFDAVINNFMLQANINNRITISGSGMQLRSFVHINEIVELLHQLLVHPVPAGTYNFAKKSLNINEIADAIEELFPGLERIYTNQHMPMTSLEVSAHSALNDFVQIKEMPFIEHLRTFQKQFTFGYSHR